MRILGDLTTNHTGAGHEWFGGRRASRSYEADFYLSTRDEYVSWLGSVASQAQLGRAELRRRYPGRPRKERSRRWLGPAERLDGWRVDVANMTGPVRGARTTTARSHG